MRFFWFIVIGVVCSMLLFDGGGANCHDREGEKQKQNIGLYGNEELAIIVFLTTY